MIIVITLYFVTRLTYCESLRYGVQVLVVGATATGWAARTRSPS